MLRRGLSGIGRRPARRAPQREVPALAVGRPHPRLRSIPGMLAWQDLEAAGESIAAAAAGGSPAAARAGRSDQPAIHVRDDRPAQGRAVESPQPAAERLLRRRTSAARAATTGSASRCRCTIVSAACWARCAPRSAARRWSFRTRASTPRPRSAPSRPSAARRSTACRRCSSPSWNIPAFRSRDTVVAADGHHGGQPLPDRAHETRGRRDGGPRNHHRLRPDGSLAADHDDPHRRSDREARRHGGPAASRESR